MHFLEECHKAEDEDKVGQAKAGPPRWQQSQYHPQGRRVVKTTKIPAAPDRYLGEPGKELGLRCESHKGFLQRGYGRWFWEATPEYMERRF